MENRSGELRIPKLRVTVEVAQGDSGSVTVDLFIAEHGGDDHRPQQIIDLLEGADRFIPARELGGRLVVLNKQCVRWLGITLADGELPVEEAPRFPEEDLYDQRRVVAVELDGGEHLAGELLYSPPPERTRVVDHLNELAGFFHLWTATRLYLVNKRYVLRVMEKEPAGERQAET